MDVIEAMRAQIAADGDLGRTALSRRVCEELGFFDALGRPREMACRVALGELERRGLLELPERQTKVRGSLTTRMGGEVGIPCRPVRGTVEALGEIRLVEVSRAAGELSKLWNDIVAAYHYLGYKPLVGAQMRYLIQRENGDWLGALGFAAAARRLAARDRFIGWSEAEREKGLQLVVGNTRFVLLPWVEVKNLASCVLARAACQLPGDWHQRYGYAPVLLETFVDSERFAGTSYRAANWVEVGTTSGRGRQDRSHAAERAVKSGASEGCKRIFLYPLHSDWRLRLGVPERAEVPEDPTDWIEREFRDCDLGDPRRTRRLVSMARDFAKRPQASIPQACHGDAAKVKAAYRLMNNQEVTLPKLLEPHRKQTIARMAEERVVLSVQDTTSLNYTAHGFTEGLGPIGTRTSEAVGLIVHDTLAITPAGLTLGVLDAQVWARDWEDKDDGRSIEEKESVKWLRSYEVAAAAQAELKNTTVVCVGDREADLYELFALAAERVGGPALLVRASGDRCVSQEQGKLWAHMESQRLAGYRELVLPPRSRRPGKPAQPARTVNLEVRFAPVVLRPPAGKRALGKLRLFAVHARETNPLDPDDPIEWMLLTTVPVTNFDQACEKLDWYTQRWQIEVFHRTLKSGCRIEERQHRSAHTLTNCLAIDMVVAARILLLTWLGRTCPDLPCTIYFEDNQWKALYCYRNKTLVTPKQVPTIREVISWVAKLGGHLGRKCDGEPGTKSLWLGLPRMDDMAEMLAIFTTFHDDS